MSAEAFRDYIGGGEWTGDTDCQLAKFADAKFYDKRRIATRCARHQY